MHNYVCIGGNLYHGSPWISCILQCAKLCIQRASVGNTFTHASPVVRSLVELPLYYKLAGNFHQFVRKLCDETSVEKQHLMATVLGPFCVLLGAIAHQKPALVVHGTREDANPSVNCISSIVTLLQRVRDLALTTDGRYNCQQYKNHILNVPRLGNFCSAAKRRRLQYRDSVDCMYSAPV